MIKEWTNALAYTIRGLTVLLGSQGGSCIHKHLLLGFYSWIYVLLLLDTILFITFPSVVVLLSLLCLSITSMILFLLITLPGVILSCILGWMTFIACIWNKSLISKLTNCSASIPGFHLTYLCLFLLQALTSSIIPLTQNSQSEFEYQCLLIC